MAPLWPDVAQHVIQTIFESFLVRQFQNSLKMSSGKGLHFGSDQCLNSSPHSSPFMAHNQPIIVHMRPNEAKSIC